MEIPETYNTYFVLYVSGNTKFALSNVPDPVICRNFFNSMLICSFDKKIYTYMGIQGRFQDFGSGMGPKSVKVVEKQRNFCAISPNIKENHDF